MPIIARSSGSPWRKSRGTITVASSTIIRRIPDNVRSIDIIVTAYNNTEDKVKTLYYKLGKESGVLKSSVHGKLGTLKISITEALIGGNIEVSITNNETFDIDYEIASLILGG